MTPRSGNTVRAAVEGATRRRADARRNIDAILDAALACLTRDPLASIADIATAAGVGRVTLYGHFGTRAELVDAAFARVVTRTDAALDAVDLTGDPAAALGRLVATSWRIVAEHRALLVAAERVLPPERIREHHDRPMRRVRALLQRGRTAGAFRTDLPTRWLVAVFYTVLHGAADEITAGRLDEQHAAATITATLLAAYTPPGAPVPHAG
jgi:AcrR family transcriptional regulator